MERVRRNVGLIGLLLGVTASVVAGYTKVALADADKRITVLESQREETNKQLQRIEENTTYLIRLHVAPGVPIAPAPRSTP